MLAKVKALRAQIAERMAAAKAASAAAEILGFLSGGSGEMCIVKILNSTPGALISTFHHSMF